MMKGVWGQRREFRIVRKEVVLKLQECSYARYEVFTAELLKTQTLWDVTLFVWVSGFRHLEGLW